MSNKFASELCKESLSAFLTSFLSAAGTSLAEKLFKSRDKDKGDHDGNLPEHQPPE